MVDSASGSKSKSRVPGDLDLENFPPLEAVIEKESSDVTGAGNTASGPGQNWNLFNQTLNYFPPTKANGQILVKPPKDVLIDGARQWDNALLGNFLGKSPPLGVFQRVADKLWGREGSIEIRFLAPSVYVLNFPSQRVRDWVLEAGPWHINQRGIILRKWVPGMVPELLKLESAPVWIKLWHVPLELYSLKGL
ncbi:hypothetical protein V6N13_047254 [Hibiscus sabdariffa]